jgi:NitT/TauT family transport system permease protein
MKVRKLIEGGSREIVRYVLALVVFVVIWEASVRAFRIQDFVLPAPLEVAKTLANDTSLYIEAAKSTIINAFIGGLIGILLGTVSGFVLAFSRTARWIAEPYLIVFQSFPRESLIPLLVVWMGFGSGPKVVNAALLSFFPMAVLTLNSLLDIRKDYIELITSWGASRGQEFMYCRLPASVISMTGALKITMPLALIGTVLGEFMGGNEGLGHVIMISGSAFRVDRIFGAITCLAAIGLLIFGIVSVVQQVLAKRFSQE